MAVTMDDEARTAKHRDAAAVEQALWHIYGDGLTIDWLSHCLTCGKELPAGSMSYCRPHLADALRSLAERLKAHAPPP